MGQCPVELVGVKVPLVKDLHVENCDQGRPSAWFDADVWDVLSSEA